MTYCYTVLDSISESYGVPFFSINDGTANRSFQQLCNDPSSTVFHNPADFSLYCSGTFDPNTGILTALTAPRFVARPQPSPHLES